MSKITSAILQKVAPGTPKAERDRFLSDFNRVLPKYGITTELRVAAFLTTVCFESDYFKALAEYASGWAYDISKNRKKALELGNTEVGDGPKYKGAGGIETTGKKNYKRLSDRLGVDFVKNPMLLRTEKYFVEAACVFWNDNNFNKLADKGKITAIQNITNRGSADKPAKALASRLKIYHNVLDILPDDFALNGSVPSEPEVIKPETPVIISTELQDPATANGNGATKIEVTDGNVKVETGGAPVEKEKVAVVASKPQGFVSRLYVKIAAAVTGNSFVQWIMDQAEKIQGWSLSQKTWVTITVIVFLGSAAWIIWEAVKSYQDKNRQKEIDKLLVQENSTPDNYVQLIPADEVDLYRARKYKIITRGEPIPPPQP